jgi:hypothetical protein
MEASSATKTDEASPYSNWFKKTKPTSLQSNPNIGNAAWQQQIDKETNWNQYRVISINSNTNSMVKGVEGILTNKSDWNRENSTINFSTDQNLFALNENSNDYSTGSSIASESSTYSLAVSTNVDNDINLENYSLNTPADTIDDFEPFLYYAFDDSDIGDVSSVQFEMIPTPISIRTLRNTILGAPELTMATAVAKITSVASDHETFERLVKLYESWQ